MKLDILIVDFAMVAAVVVPYILFLLIGRREEGKLKKKFLEEAKKYNLRFVEKDKWSSNILGLDKEKAKILLFQKIRTDIVTELIDLKEVRGCEILQEVQAVKIDQRAENVLQRLDLQLRLHNGSVKIVNLFNCEETYTQDYEMKHAERWNRTINEFAVFRPTINSAA